ncbi:uncharacterized protein LOC132322721 isoform X2 [Haemorhous mexicanus]|uniref:uncharacterized protein LOC132322721 isoform X2 n=1 Tax=Haemorhous mexicanus TaxID=30427 RepID=UPI0028BD72FE|nr:uncharacterized protein LOC132322721 isoform X2 [Haemorhous mexicanus]
MDFDPTVEEGLRRSNARFMASMNRIFETYNHPFENDILISMASLTCETPDGPKKWDTMSRKDIKKWRRKLTISPRPRSTEKQSRDFEDKHSAAHQESSENSGADTSDTGGESGAVASVGRKFGGICLKNLNVDDGQILEKKIVPVDVILQGDERNYPKWITITTPRSSKSRHSTSPGQEQLGPKKWDTMSRKDIKKWRRKLTQISPRPRSTEKQSRDFEDKHSAAHQESSENSGADTSDTGGESGAVASVGRKFGGICLKNLNVDDGQILEKKIVPVDVILQGDERNYPKWITITTPRSSKSRHSTSPGQEQLGPKKWDTMSRKDIKKWRRKLTQISPRPRSTEKQSRDFEDKHSAAHQESSENSGADTSDTGGESGAVASVGRKFGGICLKNLNVDDGQILEKKIVPVDVILQGDERNYPKWITITTPRSSKSRHSTSPGQEQLGPKKWDTMSRKDIKKWRRKLTQISPRPRSTEKQSRDFEDKHSAAHQESSENSGADTSDTGGESGAVASVGRKFGGICLKNLNVDDGQILEKKIVPVDVILQGDERNYPKWITITTPRSSKSRHSTSPGQEQLGNRSICRKRLEFSNECSSSRYPQLQHSAVPISSNTVASPRHRPRPELSTTSCDSILGEYQSADEECSLSSTTLLGLYPAMVALFTKFMTKRSQRKALKYMFGHLRSKRRHSRRPKLNVTVDKMRGFGKASGKSQGVCKHSAFPDVMDRIGETFLVEDKLQTTDSPKNLEYTKDEKFTYKHFSEPSFKTSTASSDSRAFHLVKEKKTQKTDFHVGTSELCSSACSSHGNRNNSIPTTNCSPARSSNTMFIYPQKTTSFQHKESFSSRKQNSSKTDKEIDAAFDELYYRVISGEYLKPLTLTRPLINSQNLKEKGTLVKSNQSDSERSLKQCDIEFEKLSGKSIPRSPGLQTASNFRKYEEIQIPETVNALVNSPVRTYSAISSVKRAGNFQNHPLCSPVKRLKFIPGHCFSSSKCQISHSKEGNLQTGGMDFLSTYNCSKPSFFADHICHCQGSGSHDSSHQSFLDTPGTSLQESGTAGAHSGWPGTMENCSSLRNVSKRHPRISRKLSYTDGKDQL